MIARGGNGVSDANGDAIAEIRAVTKVSTVVEATAAPIPDSGAPYASLEDLDDIDGLIIGSPTHFGNMSASLKHFFDQTPTQWFASTLAGKPAAVDDTTTSPWHVDYRDPLQRTRIEQHNAGRHTLWSKSCCRSGWQVALGQS